jgi:ribonuclease P protein component
LETVPLTGSFRFKAVYNGGVSAGGGYIVLFALENAYGVNRIGFTVSKKVGNSVVRNRTRRVIREAYRLSEGLFKTGYDFVVLARPAAASIKMGEARAELIRLSKKLKVLEGS